ncbi:hypothetical protein Desru_3415 [Desulforamulus ruminis DSM 2154]|uniref:Uncharacterized protein n=3 Tax=Desulforamulus ruminis TaxID=1564 RepID=F6DKY6_DESRL|nr:hypothetical protein Desru_3415 [Desulforamulus ruminis DSM 2154]
MSQSPLSLRMVQEGWLEVVMRRGLIFILILVNIFWHGLMPVCSAEPPEVLKQHQLLQQREQQIVAEIIQVALALDRAQREYDFVQKKLAETHQKIPAVREQLQHSEKKLALCREELGVWLRHFYIEGQRSYWFILLGAVNLGDFIQRLALVGILVSRGVEDINKTLDSIREVKEKTNQLALLEQQLVNQEKRLGQIVSQTQALQASQQKILQQTRQELGENQSRVLLVVNGLHDALKPLETLLERFRDAPWDKYRPDRLQILGTGVRAEYTENTISKLLFSGEDFSGVKASFSNRLFIIQGINKEQLPFAIAGELSVSGENVCYLPKSITIGDVTLTKELVTGIGGKEGLTYPVGLLMGWRLKAITIEEGKAVFELSPVK